MVLITVYLLTSRKNHCCREKGGDALLAQLHLQQTVLSTDMDLSRNSDFFAIIYFAGGGRKLGQLHSTTINVFAQPIGGWLEAPLSSALAASQHAPVCILVFA